MKTEIFLQTGLDTKLPYGQITSDELSELRSRCGLCLSLQSMLQIASGRGIAPHSMYCAVKASNFSRDTQITRAGSASSGARANRPLAQRIEYTHPHFEMVPKPCQRDRYSDLI